MPDHQCIQEIKIHDLENIAKNIDTKLDDIANRQQTILSLIFGDNLNGGIITKIQVQDKAISRVWWWLAGISFSILGIAIAVIKSSL